MQIQWLLGLMALASLGSFGTCGKHSDHVSDSEGVEPDLRSRRKHRKKRTSEVSEVSEVSEPSETESDSELSDSESSAASVAESETAGGKYPKAQTNLILKVKHIENLVVNTNATAGKSSSKAKKKSHGATKSGRSAAKATKKRHGRSGAAPRLPSADEQVEHEVGEDFVKEPMKPEDVEPAPSYGLVSPGATPEQEDLVITETDRLVDAEAPTTPRPVSEHPDFEFATSFPTAPEGELLEEVGPSSEASEVSETPLGSVPSAPPVPLAPEELSPTLPTPEAEKVDMASEFLNHLKIVNTTASGGSEENNSDLYDVNTTRYSVTVNFKDDVKCTELRYGNKVVWKAEIPDAAEGQTVKLPKSIYAFTKSKLIFVNLSDEASVCYSYADLESKIDEKAADGDSSSTTDQDGVSTPSDGGLEGTVPVSTPSPAPLDLSSLGALALNLSRKLEEKHEEVIKHRLALEEEHKEIEKLKAKLNKQHENQLSVQDLANQTQLQEIKEAQEQFEEQKKQELEKIEKAKEELEELRVIQKAEKEELEEEKNKLEAAKKELETLQKASQD